MTDLGARRESFAATDAGDAVYPGLEPAATGHSREGRQ